MPHSTNSRLGGGRRAALTAALGFALLEPRTRELKLLHGWLDTWRGIGDVVVGMARQDYDLQLTWYDGRGYGRPVLRVIPKIVRGSHTSTASRT